MQALISEEQLVRHHITYPVIPKIYTVGNCLLHLFKNKAMYVFFRQYTVWTVNDVLVNPYPFYFIKRVWIDQNNKGCFTLSSVQAQMYIQLPLGQWSAGNVYLLMLSS